MEKNISKKDDDSPIISQSSLTKESMLEKKTSNQEKISPIPNISQEFLKQEKMFPTSSIPQFFLEEEKTNLTFQTSKIEPKITLTPPIPDLMIKQAPIQSDSSKILEIKKVGDAPTIPNFITNENHQNLEQVLKERSNEEKSQRETKTDIQEKKEIKEETKEEDKQKEEEKQEYKTINLSILETKITELEHMKNKELEKLDLEDKNYDPLLIKVDTMLKEIKDKQKMNLNAKDKQKLKEQELKLKNMKSHIENHLANDLNKEEMRLQEELTEQELMTLEQELRNIHLENQIDFNNMLIHKAEDLETLSKDRLSIVEKALIKQKIKKASKSLELPSILFLPFLRNRHFFYFTTGVIINNHLNILNHLLRHQTVSYNPLLELEEIKKGRDALNEALSLTISNISYLNNLEQDILSKYPELSLDQEYLSYINNLKYSLIKNEEKMLKKKKMIEKYNLKYQAKVRKLKKVS